MTPTAGAHIGPYEILSRAGAGGMGEVWKARDTRLGRTVAIKISDQRFSDRFEREARAIAALNHPHICAIYDVGPDYLVMEYVEGEPVKGPLPLAKALEYAKQILEALHAAHRAGIVHRDLKPANILVGKSGVKVLDFGLAKMQHEPPIAGDDLTQLSNAISREGTIAGTLQYMAPEQLQAKEVDSRADIFAFGCVLYEMLTGKRAFDGANAASVIAAILERPAPSVGNVAPPSLDKLLKRCLAKDPEERWQDALDIRVQMEWIASGEEPSAAAIQARQRKWPMPAAIAALATALAAVCLVHLREKPVEAPLVRASISPPDSAKLLPQQRVAISRDGTRVAFISDSGGFQRIWVRPLDSASAYPIEGTEGASASPFWSPDGKSIGFLAGGKLKVVDTLGGRPSVIDERIGSFRGAVWMPDGTIIYGRAGGLRWVRSSGGSASSDLTLKDGSTATTAFVCGPLPDGTQFLYITHEGAGRYMLRAGSIASHESRPIEEVQSVAYYSSGHLLSWRSDDMIAQPFDPKRLRITGSAVPLGKGFFGLAASVNGVLAYFNGTSWALELAVVDRHGARVAGVSESLPYIGRLQLSPDGSKVITQLNDSGSLDLWTYDVSRGVKTRLTDDGDSTDGIWSPDGKTIVYSSRRNGILQMFQKASGSSGGETLLYQDPAFNKFPMSWSRDGKFLLFMKNNGTVPSLWIMPDPLAAGEKKPFVFAQSNFAIREGQFSPDGKWVAYFSNESGRFEVYVAPFPGPGPIIPVSKEGGMFARWGPRGNELFYLDPSMRLISVPIRVSGSRLEVGAEQTLFEGVQEWSGFPYDVMPDGSHFITVRLQGKSVYPNLNIIQNWPAMLKRNN